jgi:hypothetical protein
LQSASRHDENSAKRELIMRNWSSSTDHRTQDVIKRERTAEKEMELDFVPHLNECRNAEERIVLNN